MPNPDFDATVAAWDEAGRADNPRRYIHPLGIFTDGAAYERSGAEWADRILELAGDAIPGPGVASAWLDFGAGDGRVTIPLAQRLPGRTIIDAADASPAMLARLEARLKDAGVDAGNICGIRWDGTTRLFAQRPYDVVFALAVFIHHAHADVARILANLTAVTRPGGRLLIDLPLADEPNDPGHWIGVARWTLRELEILAGALELRLVAHQGDGHDLTILDKP